MLQFPTFPGNYEIFYNKTLTGQIHKVDDGALLGLVPILFDDLVKSDGDHGMGATTGRVHVGRRHCSVGRAWDK